ncbi:MAG: HpsJ family protein [Cyanobacteria bacterium P01_A01_bin.17]
MVKNNRPSKEGGKLAKDRTGGSGLSATVNRLTDWHYEQTKALTLLNWVGYGLLIFFLFDLIEIFYDPKFMNPAWELETLGKLTERVAVPLIGFGLVFIGGLEKRGEIERSWVKFLSWATLLAAIVFLLWVPLGIFDTIRINQAMQTQIDTQLEQQTEQAEGQVKAVKEQLDKVSSPEELKAFLSRLNLSEQAQSVEDPQQVAPIKNQVSAMLDNRVSNLDVQAQNALTTQRTTLIKRSLKWNLNSLVSGALFFSFWRGTRWVRQYR